MYIYIYIHNPGMCMEGLAGSTSETELARSFPAHLHALADIFLYLSMYIYIYIYIERERAFPGFGGTSGAGTLTGELPSL